METNTNTKKSRKSLYFDIKQIHHGLIADIKSLKQELTDAFKNGDIHKVKLLQFKLDNTRFEYRHRHIAYSLVRGRTREQIERKNNKNNYPSEYEIQTYFTQYKTLVESIKKEYGTNE